MGNCASKQDSVASSASKGGGGSRGRRPKTITRGAKNDESSQTSNFSSNNDTALIQSSANNFSQVTASLGATSTDKHKRAGARGTKTTTTNGRVTVPSSGGREAIVTVSVPDSVRGSPYPSSDHEQRWKLLYTHYSPKIVDSADVHSVLDECLASSVQKLNSAEMTLLSRRVRKVVRSLLADSKQASKFNSSSNQSHGSTSHSHSNGGSAAGGGTGSNGYRYNLNGKSHHIKFDSSSTLSSKKSIPSDSSHRKSLSSLEARSRAIYQKEYVLDEFLMKQIFVGGYQSLLTGMKEGWVNKSLEMYEARLKRRKKYSKGRRFRVKDNDDDFGVGGGGGIGGGWVGFVGSFDTSNAASRSDDNDSNKMNNNRHAKNYHGNGMSNGDSVEIEASPGSTSFDTYTASSKQDTRTNGSSNSNDNGSVPSSPTLSRKSNKNGKQSRWGTSRSNHNGSNNYINRKKSKYPSSAADIYFTAFHLLLNLSEKRWDYVAELARHSAQDANLILDVNEQIRHQKMKEKLEKNNLDEGEMSSSSSSSIPVPPPEYPSHETYADLQSPPPALPNGITLQEISYIVATALRSSREKRLVLLFHLLLQPESLVEFLESHPGGGLPTWLLEMDNDWILSYASLGHYYYYGGTPHCDPFPISTSFGSKNGSTSQSSSKGGMNGLFSTPKSVDWSSSTRGEGIQSSGVKELKIDTLTAIETVAILLHYVPQRPLFDDEDDSDEINDKKYAGGTPTRATETKYSSPIMNKPKRQRTLSYGDKKYHAAKMHVMLADYLRKLQQNSGEAPQFENEVEQFWRLELLDTFWDGSKSTYMRCKNDYEEMSWTMKEFITWANKALPDNSALDLIMHQIFGVGLLPTPAMERKLVSESWIDWQVSESRYFDHSEFSDTISIMTLGIKNLLTFSSSRDGMSNANGDDDSFVLSSGGSAVWGGIGGFDGRGGLGSGIMYCIDKEWWDQWATYVGWEWSDGSIQHASRKRPHDLSTEKLLDHNSESVVRGTLGSYELMKKGMKKNTDYVLVPPRVWDILYELYGGGPPLPRMVMRPNISRPADNASIDIGSSVMLEKPMKVPRILDVITHPWVLECRVCDPHQPYRRGDVGHMSIRIMATPYQPLWRLFAEIVLRLPIAHPRGKNSKGKGCARLWKKIQKEESPTNKNSSGVTRYGPWELLLKRGSAAFPVGENLTIDSEIYDSFQESWESYADKCTMESIGLLDGDKLMFEYALVGKDGNFTWPREAAAKAGKLQRENEEENAFRRKLRGLDVKGNVVKNTNSLVGTIIDAMDSSGRWYQAEITDVDTSSKQSTDTESDDDTYDAEAVEEKQDASFLSGEVRAIRVDFSDVGGEEEWIDVNSDRLAAHKRFTLDSMKSVDQLDTAKSNNEGNSNSRSSSLIVLRKHSSKQPSTSQLQTSVCSYPGFGACGLYNLGNTCYANSALQCITYMPLLRSYLLSGQFKRNGDLNRDNPLGTGGKVLEEFAELLKGMWSAKSGAISPSRFRMHLARAKPRYSGTEQQDSQELLNDMLDVLHEDSNKILKKPYVEAIEDAWLDKTDLSRIGEETWRRYLRRNRSVIANICMGQVLNRVTCPSCNYTSRIFEPFNMLSLPFPNVTEVLFRCIVIRRASALNCTKTLSYSEKNRNRSTIVQPPSKQLIAEEYIIPMSRVADISELKIQLGKISGITKERLKLYTVLNGEIENFSTTDKNISLSLIPEDKNGPCWHFSSMEKTQESSTHTTSIIAYEITFNPRPEQEKSAARFHDLSSDAKGNSTGVIEEALRLYGDQAECRLYDTNPQILSKKMSRILWPRSAADLTVGLRVDAIDHRSHWFPGTIVEVIQVENNGAAKSSKNQKMKIKVHFDNFSKKWDLTYSLDDIRAGKVQPLYSHSRPKDKPLEVQIFHSNKNDPLDLFGFPFFTHCQIEWSNARAGAHILSQASRYLEGEPQRVVVDGDQNIQQFVNFDSKDSEVSRRCKDAQKAIGKTIDVLIDADKQYVKSIMSFGSKGDSESIEKISGLSSWLKKKMALLLPLLPFEVVVYDAVPPTSPDGNNCSKTTPFEFSLSRTIGNCMNARQEIIICWREIKKSSNYGEISFFSPPKIHKHHVSYDSLRNREKHLAKSNRGNTQNGMRLDSCLDEFCNEQQLDESECWRCPKCKELREGRQRMNVWRLPDILTFHLKRFNCSARWREKITNKVNFPLTGLDMREWCDKQSPALQGSDDNCVYDLIGVVNHYGGMTSGHYISVSKATACSPGGSEEVEHYFNGAGVHAFGGTDEKEVQPALWKLIRSKEKDANNMQSKAAQASAKSAAESSEPLWLQFDDESVEPIPPSEVVSQMAYVLFYRRRRITPSNIAKYSTIE